MLDKNITKIINLSDPKYTWGQKADGTWYCKEFKSETIEDGDTDINQINKVLNKYNIKEEKTPKKNPSKKQKDKLNVTM